MQSNWEVTESAQNEAHKTTRFIFWFVKVTLVVITEESSEENLKTDAYQLPITIFQVTQKPCTIKHA